MIQVPVDPDPHDSRELSFTFQRWGSGGTEKIQPSSKVIQAVSGKTGIQTQVWLLNVCFLREFPPLDLGAVSPVHPSPAPWNTAGPGNSGAKKDF